MVADLKIRTMPFRVRPMTESDLHQCARVEREAFPSLLPPTSFKRELTNRLARYLVAERIEQNDEGGETTGPVYESRPRDTLIRRIISGAMPNARQVGTDLGQVSGFIGTWYMAAEAHIVNIGVSTVHRGRGVGELLLIAAIERAVRRGSRLMTLEVRDSNFIARNLYHKYGFTERGVRKAYYSDNREDAVIMTTDPIAEPAFQSQFQELAQALRSRGSL